MNKLWGFIFILLTLLLNSCGTVVRNIDNPISYKEFIIQGAELENAVVSVSDVYVIGLNIYTKVNAENAECYVLAVSPTVPTNKNSYAFGMQMMMGGAGLLIPLTNKTLLSKSLDFQAGDKISTARGKVVYSTMKMGMMSMKNSVPAILVFDLQ